MGPGVARGDPVRSWVNLTPAALGKSPPGREIQSDVAEEVLVGDKTARCVDESVFKQLRSAKPVWWAFRRDGVVVVGW